MADDTGDTDDNPDDRLRDRVDESRTKLWLLLEADRRLVIAGLVVAVAVSLLAAGLSLPAVTEALRQSDSIDTLFQALLTATITGVTLNQLVLSQELGAVGDQCNRMDGAMTFREDAADIIGAGQSRMPLAVPPGAGGGG
jgi:hypothetical protein